MGGCMLAAVGHINSPQHSVASIERIRRRPGDSMPLYKSWTSGTLARQYHFDEFLGSDKAEIFLLDTDMEYQADCLERLRSRGLPVASGLYMRRDAGEPLPAAWVEPLDVDEFPPEPLTDFPHDALIPVAAAGHGFLYLQRRVVEDLVSFFAGQPLMLRAPMPDWTGNPELHVGPDLRMGYALRKLGYRIWLDTGCRAEHWAYIKLRVEDYEAGPWRRDHIWHQKTAIARIARRRQMKKEDLLLLGEDYRKSRDKLLVEKQNLNKEAEEAYARMSARLQQIEKSLDWHEGILHVLEQIYKAEKGEVVLTGRKPEVEHIPEHEQEQ